MGMWPRSPALTAKAVREGGWMPLGIALDGMALAIHMSEGLKALDATMSWHHGPFPCCWQRTGSGTLMLFLRHVDG